MSFDLYYVPPSAPCRSVLLVGKELGIEFNLKVVNLMEKEQLKPEFLAVSLTERSLLSRLRLCLSVCLPASLVAPRSLTAAGLRPLRCSLSLVTQPLSNDSSLQARLSLP